MKQLLNTLYITKPDVYLATQGENIVIRQADSIVARCPFHNLQDIVLFSYLGMSPKLLERCVKYGIGIAYLSPNGRLIARMQGKSKGNILLRRIQYRVADNEDASLAIVKNIILAKIYNEKWTLERYIRQYKQRIDTINLENASHNMSEMMTKVRNAESVDMLRGFEGSAQVIYFSCFDDMILNQKKDFEFGIRSRRPPLNRVNAVLSFLYAVLSNDIASCLETVGLDAYAGFMHTDRPGRVSLALDLVEEFRAAIVDRLVLSLVNKRIIAAGDFESETNGSVLLNDDGRRKVISKWQERKKEEITHPYLNEKMPWGLVPFVQANLLARYLRNDIDAYPPFFWK
ncbi:type I-C CRISPR-associated endonuclease Cas1c [Pectinatus frisingensis]|uniref:type I-C CRISPR-associated endonuclease Cas1c n=1 Tax=Pectinatus frisingensis TaxID=865 RepID=UPI0018C51038|nr:type I-C CRISPR-associated endonuclease Cas1c [Pectinatus frisingensis]